MELEISRWFKDNSDEIAEISERIFNLAEAAYEEHNSSKTIADYLASYGFKTESGIGGIPTAFRSRWGKGKPVIGFLGEYDALPGLNQGREPYYTGDKSRNGHGCGHNLLGAGSAAAAAALARALEAQGRQGTIVYYGCPAEETLEGKIKMMEAGCFKELDAALSWHPLDCNMAGEAKYQVMDSIEFAFTGVYAHAAVEPHLGRSALDACELMNVGVNYLREHVPDDVRMHYCYLNAGEKPNIVPGYARVLYYIRNKDRRVLDDVTARVTKVAEGAALMTGTEVSARVRIRGSETILNNKLIQHLYEIMTQIDIPEYTDEEKEFMKVLAKNAGLPAAAGELCREINPPTGKPVDIGGSTDLSSVSQIVPTGFIFTSCLPKGVSLHHWACTACAGSSVGNKGMLYAAKVLAQCGYDLIADEALLEQVKKAYLETQEG